MIISYYEKCLVNAGQTARHQSVFGTWFSIITDRGAFTHFNKIHTAVCLPLVIVKYELFRGDFKALM